MRYRVADVLSVMSYALEWMASIHHEKLDGSGYAFRLRGDQIDEPARMLDL